MPAARSLAAQMLELSPVSLRAPKQVFECGPGKATLKDAYRKQLLPSSGWLAPSADSHEGPLAFAKKHLPRWTGR